jgi:hypothetical protein
LLNNRSTFSGNPLKTLGSFLPSTGSAYAQVHAGVRKGQNRDIGFAIQDDREAIGRALAEHSRQPGVATLREVEHTDAVA